MSGRDDGHGEERERRAHLPVEQGRRTFDELEPHQRKIERAASLYFSGCRTVARAITAIKNQLSDGDGDR